MPSTPYAKLLVSVNGGPWTSGDVDVAVGDEVAFKLESTVGVGSQRWELYDYPPGFALPIGWSADSEGVYYSTAATPPNITINPWGKYLPRARINGDLTKAEYVDSTTGLSAPSPSGLRDMSDKENKHFGKSWVEDHRANLRTLETGLAGFFTLQDPKDSVRTATTGALPAYTRTGNTITGNANGALPNVGGVALAAGDDFLLWHGAAAQDNGIWRVGSLGDGGSPFTATRRADADTSAKVTSGLRVPVTEGTYAGRVFRLATADPITLNTTALTFVLDTALADGSSTDQILKWNGTSWIAGALNLAAAAAVTGILAFANGGTGLAGPAGAPDADKVLRVNAAGSAYELAKLTTANLSATAGILGSQLAANAAVAASQLANAAAGTVLAGGSPNAFTATPTVTSVLTGAAAASGATLSATSLLFGESVATPTLKHSARTSDAATSTLTLEAQSAWASATGANRDGANLVFKAGAAAAGGTNGRIYLNIGATTAWNIYESLGAGYLSTALIGIIQSTSGYIQFSGAVGPNYIDTATTSGTCAIYYRGTGYGTARTDNLAPTGAMAMTWGEGGTSVTYTQATRTTDAATASTTISAQSAYASATGTNRNAGNLLLKGGTKAAGGTDGSVEIYSGALRLALFGGQIEFGRGLGIAEGVSNPGVYHLARTSDAATSGFTIQAQSAWVSAVNNLSGGRLSLKGGDKKAGEGAVTGGVDIYAGSTTLVCKFDDGLIAPQKSIEFAAALTNTSITQTAPASDVAPSNLLVQAQGAYGSATVNKTGATLILKGGQRVSNGNDGGVKLVTGNNDTVFEIDALGGNRIGFFATSPAAKQDVTGSRGGNAALASLLTALATYGFITNSSTA